MPLLADVLCLVSFLSLITWWPSLLILIDIFKKKIFISLQIVHISNGWSLFHLINFYLLLFLLYFFKLSHPYLFYLMQGAFFHMQSYLLFFQAKRYLILLPNRHMRKWRYNLCSGQSYACWSGWSNIPKEEALPYLEACLRYNTYLVLHFFLVFNITDNKMQLFSRKKKGWKSTLIKDSKNYNIYFSTYNHNWVQNSHC